MRPRLVRFLKIALPLAAAGLIAAIFAFPSGGVRGLRMEGVEVGGDGLRLERPRFSGADAEGRPFTVEAEWALPDAPDPQRVELGPLRGEATPEAGRRATLVAGGGLLRVPEETLRLVGGVALTTSDGWRLRADRAEADLDSGALVAEGSVRGEGPEGALAARSLRAERGEDGYVLRFEGGVRLTLPGRGEEATR